MGKKTKESKIDPAAALPAPGVSVPVYDAGELEAEWNERMVQKEDEARIMKNRLAAPVNDRMMRYRRNPRCPACDAHPTVCMLRSPGYSLHRCRECGHRWEVKGA